MPPRSLPAQVDEPIKAIVRIIRKYLPEKAYSIYLFGSWARADALPHSDLDIAISGADPVEGLTLARIRDELDDLPTLRKVDLVDLPSVGQGLRQSILDNHLALD